MNANVRTANGPRNAQPTGSLLDLVRIALAHKVFVGASVLVVTIAAVVYALVATPVYRTQVVVAPVEDDGLISEMAGLAGQFGGLASLVGLALPKGQVRTEAIATLRSREFAAAFIRDHNLLPVLFHRKWDAEAGRWRNSNPVKQPTMWDGVEYFTKHVRDVREDAKTGLVTLRIDWRDREVAARWANELVERLNETMRSRALKEADVGIQFLERELSRAEGVELRNAINRLLEVQVKRRMLANVRQQFAFRVIDPAVVPDADDRHSPRRKLVVLAGALAGGLLGLIGAIFLDFRRRYLNA